MAFAQCALLSRYDGAVRLRTTSQSATPRQVLRRVSVRHMIRAVHSHHACHGAEQTSPSVADQASQVPEKEILEKLEIPDVVHHDLVNSILNFPPAPTREESVHKPDIFHKVLRWWNENPKDAAMRLSLLAAVLSFTVSLALRPESSPPHSLFVPSEIEALESPAGLIAMLQNFIRGPSPLISSVLVLSTLAQAISGFGFAIVAVGLISQVQWIANSNVFNDIQPIAAIVGSFVGTLLLLPEIHEVELSEILPLIIASLAFTPVGVAALGVINVSVAIKMIGALILGFVTYLISGVKFPPFVGSRAGAWIAGAFAGLLGGAFDISGPPLVFYGKARNWEPGQFRRNILAVVTLNSFTVTITDFFTGRLDDYYVGQFVLSSAPLVAVAIVMGKYLSSKIDPTMFKKIVLGSCLLMGFQLLFT